MNRSFAMHCGGPEPGWPHLVALPSKDVNTVHVRDDALQQARTGMRGHTAMPGVPRRSRTGDDKHMEGDSVPADGSRTAAATQRPRRSPIEPSKHIAIPEHLWQQVSKWAFSRRVSDAEAYRNLVAIGLLAAPVPDERAACHHCGRRDIAITDPTAVHPGILARHYRPNGHQWCRGSGDTPCARPSCNQHPHPAEAP